jgi:hypothetical protein
MKKILLLILVGILILNFFQVIAISNGTEDLFIDNNSNSTSNMTKRQHDSSITMSLNFFKPTIIESGKYVEVVVKGTNALLFHTGKPILPIYRTTLNLPFITQIVDIHYDPEEIKTIFLSKKIVPAPPPIIQGIQQERINNTINTSIYNSNDFFPQTWFDYYTDGGLDQDNKHKTFCTLQIYPVRYSSKNNVLQYVEKMNITIFYEELPYPFPENASYDMVIIAPSQFSEIIQQLIDHKNKLGINTTFKSVEDIYTEYQGVDKPEQIKYFIKDAIEQWKIKYVLLIGGLKSILFAYPRDDKNQGTISWFIPVRYTNLIESGSIYDPGFISDLYYADIYTGDGNFSSWDSNSDGIFAKWTESGIDKDIINFYPDVYVGRLPCRNDYEVKIMVNKILNYEQSAAHPSWYNKMVVVGGDAFNDSGTDFIEGELIGDKVLSYMPYFNPIKLYGSYRYSNPENTPLTVNIKREISSGCGHLFFDGHAHPGNWNTGWPGEFDRLIPKGGISVYDFPYLRNLDKLPICVAGGCHNSQFNVSFLTTMLKLPFMWTFGIPVPECWSWHLTRKIGGGSIATIGNTGLGYEAGWEYGDRDGDGVNEPDCVEAYGGYLERCFYKTFNESIDILGDVWGGAIRKYLFIFPGMDFQWDAKVIEEWILFGDPSLKIGGYN